MTPLSPCPFCGSTDLKLTFGVVFAIWCKNPECRATGPEGETEEDAWKNWNKRHEAPKGFYRGDIGSSSEMLIFTPDGIVTEDGKPFGAEGNKAIGSGSDMLTSRTVTRSEPSPPQGDGTDAEVQS